MIETARAIRQAIEVPPAPVNLKELARAAVLKSDLQGAGKVQFTLRKTGLTYKESFELVEMWTGVSLPVWDSLLMAAGA